MIGRGKRLLVYSSAGPLGCELRIDSEGIPKVAN